MRRKLVIICMAACMLCLAIGCGTGKDNNVADESTSATNNNSSAELKKTDAVSEPVAKQEVEKQNDSNLEVEDEYKNLPESEGFVFESNGDGTCDLKEIGLCKDTDIVIPEKSPEGDVVTKIDEYAFYDAEDIASIIFAGRNMEIADNAFQSCEVEKLVISGCELSIGESAFSYCDDLSSIYISNSTVNIDEYAFYDAGKNAEITIQNVSGVLDDNSFQSCAVQNVIIGCGNVELGKEAFAYCEALSGVEFKGSALKVGSDAFYDCLDELTILYKGVKYNKQSIEDAV